MDARALVAPLMADLVMILRDTPTGARNAVEHMWGYVRKDASREEAAGARGGWPDMLRQTQVVALRTRQAYLLASTALSELAVYPR
jgi:hypothetical protein